MSVNWKKSSHDITNKSTEKKGHTLVNAGFATPESWRECILIRGSTRFDELAIHRFVVDRSRGEEIRYDMRIPLEPVIDVHSHTLDIFINSAAIHVQHYKYRYGLELLKHHDAY